MFMSLIRFVKTSFTRNTTQVKKTPSKYMRAIYPMYNFLKKHYLERVGYSQLISLANSELGQNSEVLRQAVAAVLAKHGYTVVPSHKNNHDLLAERDNAYAIIRCSANGKAFCQASKFEVEEHEVANLAQECRQLGANAGIFVSLCDFTKEAKQLGKQSDIFGIASFDLFKLVRQQAHT
jgi:hypothetical protein